MMDVAIHPTFSTGWHCPAFVKLGPGVEEKKSSSIANAGRTHCDGLQG